MDQGQKERGLEIRDNATHSQAGFRGWRGKKKECYAGEGGGSTLGERGKKSTLREFKMRHIGRLLAKASGGRKINRDFWRQK